MALVRLSPADIESAVMEWTARAHGDVPDRVIVDVVSTGRRGLQAYEAYIAYEFGSKAFAARMDERAKDLASQGSI